MIFSASKWNKGGEIRPIISVSKDSAFDMFEAPLRNGFETYIRPVLGEDTANELIEFYAEVTPSAREESVHASRHLVRPCEQPGLGVVGGVGVVADGRDLQRHEQHHDVDASYELEQFAQSSSLI